jgi:hypothetical protein
VTEQRRPLATEETAKGDTEFANEAQQLVAETVSEVLGDNKLLKGHVPQGARLAQLLG